jgi:plasmid stability protein
MGCADDVAHVTAEAVPAELALAAAKTGEIEAEDADPLLGQRPRHPNRCE